jgi:transcriptional regulator with XRE-family HTH domain
VLDANFSYDSVHLMTLRSDHPLRAWRRENEATLADLAKLVGCKEAHLSHIENKRKPPSFALAHRLSLATKIPLEAFVLIAEAAE